MTLPSGGPANATDPGLDRAPLSERLPNGQTFSPLEDEREFWLRSLRDIEHEHNAGELDEADYQALRDSYTVRAAAVLRQLDAELTAPLQPQPAGASAESAGQRPDPAGHPDGGEPKGRAGAAPLWRKRTVLALGVVLLAGGTAWSLLSALGSRMPGQVITGQALGAEAIAQSLQQAQQAADRGDAITALKDYQKVLATDPNQPEALTGEGWILAQTQQPVLLRQALSMLSSAEQVAPTYPPAHLYRGITLLGQGDYQGAIPELQWYLAHDPDPQVASQVRSTLQNAEAKAAATAGKTPSSVPPGG